MSSKTIAASIVALIVVSVLWGLLCAALGLPIEVSFLGGVVLGVVTPRVIAFALES